MTTKEQERKVLDQIRKLVDGLGEDSYIGTALEGCLDVARDNIENDWACSMKQRAEAAEKRLDDLTRKYDEDMAHMRAVKEHLEKIRDDLTEREQAHFYQAAQIRQRSCDLEGALVKKDDELAAAKHDTEELAEQLKQKDLEIMKLKARLFDLMNA